MKKVLFSCSQVPILQNRVYSTKKEAKSVAVGELEVLLDSDFASNERFDEASIKYDAEYNNLVPSPIFDKYYDRIADYLAGRYDLTSKPVVEIGCGKGVFLKQMSERYDFKGVGIDPSYVGPSTVGNLTFIAEELKERYFEFEPALVICRHTIEHIPGPTAFLNALIKAFPEKTQFPVYCEVPDLGWILKQNSWWDFCYEHVNYFTKTSFKRCLRDASCGDVEVTTAFGGQYLWAEGIANSVEDTVKDESQGLRIANNLNVYVEGMMLQNKLFAGSRKIVIWGMATKGVMYALQAEAHGVHISYSVDINKEKQGKFAPVSGLRIDAPEDLPVNESYAVICMNPNYSEEVDAQLKKMNLDFVLINP